MQVSIAIPLGALVVGAIVLLVMIYAARSARRRRKLAKLRSKQEADRLTALERSIQPPSRIARFIDGFRKSE